MTKLLEILNGKKTYIIMAISFTAAGLEAIGHPIPEFVWPMLGALGLGTLRAAVKKGEI